MTDVRRNLALTYGVHAVTPPYIIIPAKLETTLLDLAFLPSIGISKALPLSQWYFHVQFLAWRDLHNLAYPLLGFPHKSPALLREVLAASGR